MIEKTTGKFTLFFNFKMASKLTKKGTLVFGTKFQFYLLMLSLEFLLLIATKCKNGMAQHSHVQMTYARRVTDGCLALTHVVYDSVSILMHEHRHSR